MLALVTPLSGFPGVSEDILRYESSASLHVGIYCDSTLVGLIALQLRSPDVEVFPYQLTVPSPVIANLDIDIDMVFTVPAYHGAGLGRFIASEVGRLLRCLIRDCLTSGALNLQRPRLNEPAMVGVYGSPVNPQTCIMYKHLISEFCSDIEWFNDMENLAVPVRISSYHEWSSRSQPVAPIDGCGPIDPSEAPSIPF
jgi:hypothetical protein